jgi:hypothetical protein
MPTAGGAPQHLATLEGGDGRILAWAPDGKSLLTGPYRITLAGEVTKPDYGSQPFTGIRTQPGGNKIVFFGTNGGKSEVWALENFLTTAVTDRK